MYYTVDDLKDIHTAKKAIEDRLEIDRSMFIKGREGYPTPPPENLSDRDRECYMMGYNLTETLQDM